MDLHSWWTSFGIEVLHSEQLTPVLARELASLAAAGELPSITLIGLRESTDKGYAGVCLDIEVERPQHLACLIKATEPIAVLFPFDGGQPSVLALRNDFPDTPHQNWSPIGMPCALCIDDRPWIEAQLSTTASDIARRIQFWLAKAACGNLHDTAQPLDPLFFVSSLGLVLPATVLSNTTGPVELVGVLREDNENLILAWPMPPDNEALTFTILAFQAQPQAMTRLRHAPTTIAELSATLEQCGIDFIAELKIRLKEWAGFNQTDVRRLSSRFAIVVTFPVVSGGRQAVNDVRAFLTFDTAGEIGVALGVLYANKSQVGDKHAYMMAIPEAQPNNQYLQVEPTQVHFTLDRELASTISGHTVPDRRRALLVGAGSLGSQLAINLAREGMFAWTVVDDDYILPHNLTRHALFADSVGAPKADALAHHLSALLREPAQALHANIIKPEDTIREKLTIALAESDIIIDTSASIAVSRYLASLPNVKARRVCAFFNPTGTAVVLLAEDADHSITLQDLEAQYYRLVVCEPLLAGHLNTDTLGVRYSGSCRALTNRISASRAALLSALAARGIDDALTNDGASISVWTMNSNDEVRLIRRTADTVTRVQLGIWTLAYDVSLLTELAILRQHKLPNETGGVLLGIADMSRKSIHIAHALPEPEDSQGTQTCFERGVVGLPETLDRAIVATMHQLRYVGEWHSHPDRTSAMPSVVDINQLVWLNQELEKEGLPSLVAIAAQDGHFSFMLSNATSSKKHSK
jgi:hypothetical protein